MVHHFRQVDVFSAKPLCGNPVAVVHDADDLSGEQMAAFARWTNLSETTFLLAPSEPAADYRLRIFTPSGELPFAGHPTLGSAHAWLEAGGTPRAERLVQQCEIGLVEVRRDHARLAFAAPPLRRGGPVQAADLARIAGALAIDTDAILDSRWCDNGPGWVGVLLRDADAVLALAPDPTRIGAFAIGVVGQHPPGGPTDLEVRAFIPSVGVVEDPVTGSLNAAIGQWLAGNRLPPSYVAAQGTAMQREGRVYVDRTGDTVWVGGDTRTTVIGSVDLRGQASWPVTDGLPRHDA